MGIITQTRCFIPPEFPRYESKAQLTTQAPSVPAVASTEAQITENKARAFGAVQKETDQWINALDTVQKTTATANFRTGITDIQNRAQNDPDYNNSEQYIQEIEQLRKDNLRGFASKTAENEMALNFGYEAKVAQLQIGNIYKKKLIDVGQASTLRLIDNEVNNPNENSLINIKNILDSQIKSGLISREDAYKLEARANKDLGVNRISKDLYQAQTPEQVDAITQAITSGEYEKGGVTIEPDKKKSLLDIAETARKNTEKKIEAQQIEAQAQNRVATIAGVASGEINLQTLDIAQISEYDPKLGAALSKAKEFMTNYNPKVPIEEQRVSMTGVLEPSEIIKARNYAKSVQEVFNHNDNQKLGEFMLRELQKKGDGTNQSVKVAAFMQLASLKVKANNPQNQEDLQKADRLKQIKAGVSFLQSSNPYLAPQAVGDFIVKNFLSGSSKEKQVMDEAKSVLKDKILERYQAVSKLSAMPNKIVDGEASVEDLQSGLNELKEGSPSGNYGDQSSRE